MNWPSPLTLIASLLVLPLVQAQAQDSAVSTNDAPTLKQLMTTNSVVTNSIGLVLVKISPTLWAGKFDTTQEVYEKLMHANPSAFRGPQRPVDSVSWDDAVDFCSRLTSKEKDILPTGFAYSLPTQAQWEALVGDASLRDAVMRLNNGNISSTAPVGTLRPNNLGLYDMRGNVWAWCLDSHDPNVRVLRGGAWNTFDEPSSRIVFRWFYSVHNDRPLNSFGFRVILQSGGGSQ